MAALSAPTERINSAAGIVEVGAEGGSKKHDCIFVTSTMCSSSEPELDVRARLNLRAAREAQAIGVRMLAVDASKTDALKVGLEAAGALVHKQTFAGRKGAALREGITLALDLLSEDGVIVVGEAEKVGFVRFVPLLAAACRAVDPDTNQRPAVVMPRRSQEQFAATYPREQVASETFANHHLDNLARSHCPELFAKVAGGKGELDWTCGPFAMHRAHAGLWLNCQGDLWDAQLVPVIHAIRRGHCVSELTVPYEHPPEMKAEEEGSVQWGQKRLFQLQFLFDSLEKGWTESLS